MMPVNKIKEVVKTSPIVPVLTLDDAAQAHAVGEALVTAGVKLLEVTLRTEAGLQSIKEMSRIEGAVVGAGTVLDAELAKKAVDAGATFLVSPGLSAGVAKEAERLNVPYLPGVATSTDIMQARDLGINWLKFFPAGALGGIKTLKGYASVFPEIEWMPSGGISENDYAQWLELSKVIAVGGSWLTSGGADAKEIHARAKRLKLVA
ncbi:bifunctional 4-hydroxy-2-oxoglutarate aldolase/2-dehydro-3-deoxy-phosphogluconate aldolase [Acetobacteraceae bacterium]|nr:bifunctional 4-hydroxy-2-oxoglutarate aldolase/2-dehydro-3-deoxy-phosphogluconate aldolase [Acetobacteraceae bacterium]